jgi:dihydrofolate synthase/folylpolyglutamate synthase
LRERLTIELTATLSPDVAAALDGAWRTAQPGDRVIAFGSFFVASAALVFARQRDLADA